MKSTKFLFFGIALAMTVAVLAFAPDPAAAAGMLLLANAPAAIDMKALEAGMKEYGEKMQGFLEKQADTLADLKERMLWVEQKQTTRIPLPEGNADNAAYQVADLITKSPNLESYQRRLTEKACIEIPHYLLKSLISNPSVTGTGSVNTLVPAERRPEIVMPPMRRFAVRDLLPNVMVSSGSVEFAKETTYTNNAQIQGVGSSPAESEGQIKGESAFAFTLTNVTVPTIAHWTTASRQILSDAAQLQRYIGQRLVYGLRYEEEDEFINGDGSGGHINGLINQATAFNGGVTNATAIDTLGRAMKQLLAADYMPTGVILNPQDWMDIVMLKDVDTRYLLGTPQSLIEPRIFGLPVATSNTLGAGTFIMLDATRAGFIADRESAEVRISDQHSDYFTRNLVVLLAEERTTLVVEQAGAIITGNLSHAG